MTEQRISRIETNFRFVWSEYLRWYTFLTSLNLVGLGFFVGNVEQSRWFVPAAFLVFDVLGLMTALIMLPYTRDLLEEIARLDAALQGERPEQKLRGSEGGIPKYIAYWAAIANAVSLVLFIALWIYFIVPQLA